MIKVITYTLLAFVGLGLAAVLVPIIGVFGAVLYKALTL